MTPSTGRPPPRKRVEPAGLGFDSSVFRYVAPTAPRYVRDENAAPQNRQCRAHALFDVSHAEQKRTWRVRSDDGRTGHRAMIAIMTPTPTSSTTENVMTPAGDMPPLSDSPPNDATVFRPGLLGIVLPTRVGRSLLRRRRFHRRVVRLHRDPMACGVTGSTPASEAGSPRFETGRASFRAPPPT